MPSVLYKVTVRDKNGKVIQVHELPSWDNAVHTMHTAILQGKVVTVTNLYG